MAEEKMKAKKGLEGLIADESAISSVDIEKKSLLYRGYNINDLCAKSSFLEVAYLLLYGELPKRAQLDEFEAYERDNREIPDAVYETFRKIPAHTHPMDYLRLGVSMVALFDERNKYGDNTHEENLRKARWLLAKMPTIVANSYRAVHGQEIKRPRKEYSFTQNFLYMLRGQPVTDELMIRTFDTTLMLYAEHGFNASTFSARVTASTLSDFYSAVDAAIGTLKGPLHGGANEQVMYMLQEIGEPEKAEAYMLDALAKKKKIMGFGHRLYRKGDSRSEIIKNLGYKLGQKLGITKWHEICQILEDTMMREKGIYTNLDFPVAPSYYLMEIPIDLYTPIFASSRLTGWAAHIIEQHDNNRLIRPSSEYVGPKSRDYVDIQHR
jgi:2-methylcitrate synthase/citrate synthase II